MSFLFRIVTSMLVISVFGQIARDEKGLEGYIVRLLPVLPSRSPQTPWRFWIGVTTNGEVLGSDSLVII